MASTSSPGARNDRLEGALQCTCLTSQCKHLEFVSPAVGTATFTTKFNPQIIVQVQKKKEKKKPCPSPATFPLDYKITNWKLD